MVQTLTLGSAVAAGGCWLLHTKAHHLPHMGYPKGGVVEKERLEHKADPRRWAVQGWRVRIGAGLRRHISPGLCNMFGHTKVLVWHVYM